MRWISFKIDGLNALVSILCGVVVVGGVGVSILIFNDIKKINKKSQEEIVQEKIYYQEIEKTNKSFLLENSNLVKILFVQFNMTEKGFAVVEGVKTKQRMNIPFDGKDNFPIPGDIWNIKENDSNYQLLFVQIMKGESYAVD